MEILRLKIVSLQILELNKKNCLKKILSSKRKTLSRKWKVLKFPIKILWPWLLKQMRGLWRVSWGPSLWTHSSSRRLVGLWPLNRSASPCLFQWSLPHLTMPKSRPFLIKSTLVKILISSKSKVWGYNWWTISVPSTSLRNNLWTRWSPTFKPSSKPKSSQSSLMAGSSSQ